MADAVEATVLSDVDHVDSPGSTLHDYVKGDFKLSMWIPEEFAGRVVGKSGIVICNIQRETQASLRALSRVGDSLWVAVVIMGEWKNILAAYKAVSNIVHGEVDDVVLEFMINYKKPFFLYGKQKPFIIKAVSAKSNVRIYIPDFDVKRNLFKDAEVCTLEGNLENVQTAVILLEEEARGYREAQKERKRNPPVGAVGEPDTVAKGPKDAMTILKARKDKPEEQEPTNWRVDAKERREAKEKERELEREARKEKAMDGTDSKEKEREKVSKKAKESASEAKPKSVEEVRTQNEGPQVKKFISIPSNLVGMFLSKRASKASILNTIQVATDTRISKTYGPRPPAPATLAVPAVVVAMETLAVEKEATDDAESRLRRFGVEGTSDAASSDDEPSEDTCAFEDTIEPPVEPKATSSSAFRILGWEQRCVDLAGDFIARVVSGDLVERDLEDELKRATADLPVSERTRKWDKMVKASRKGSNKEDKTKAENRDRSKPRGPPAVARVPTPVAADGAIKEASKDATRGPREPRAPKEGGLDKEGTWVRGNGKPSRREYAPKRELRERDKDDKKEGAAGGRRGSENAAVKEQEQEK